MKPKKETPAKTGQDYFYGTAQKKNYKKAFPYLLEAANLGDINCQNLVGICYANGLGTEQDSSQALFWYEKAAKFHHPEALFNLGVIYDHGHGVEVDAKKAFLFYLKAANLADERAQTNLAILYLNGTGIEQNVEKGMEWLRKAARNNDPLAHYILGMSYFGGRNGVRQSDHYARIWFEKAAAQGHKEALKKLSELNPVE